MYSILCIVGLHSVMLLLNEDWLIDKESNTELKEHLYNVETSRGDRVPINTRLSMDDWRIAPNGPRIDWNVERSTTDRTWWTIDYQSEADEEIEMDCEQHGLRTKCWIWTTSVETTLTRRGETSTVMIRRLLHVTGRVATGTGSLKKRRLTLPSVTSGINMLVFMSTMGFTRLSE